MLPVSSLLRRKTEFLDWKKIAALDLDRLELCLESPFFSSLLSQLINCDPTGEFPSLLDPAFKKVFNLAQLFLNYLSSSLSKTSSKLIETERKLGEKNEELGRKEEYVCKLKKKLNEAKEELRRRKEMIEMNLKEISGNDKKEEDECPYCEKTFQNAIYLYSHVQRRHQGLPLPSFYPQNFQPMSFLHSNPKNNGEPMRRVQDENLLSSASTQTQNENWWGEKSEITKINEKNEKMKEELESQWRVLMEKLQKTEMENLKASLLEEIHKNQEALLNSTLIQKAEDGKTDKEIVKKDGRIEVEELKRDLEGAIQNEISTFESRLESQERFWRAKIRSVENVYREQLEEFRQEISILLANQKQQDKNNNNNQSEISPYKNIQSERRTKNIDQSEFSPHNNNNQSEKRTQNIHQSETSPHRNNNQSERRTKNFNQSEFSPHKNSNQSEKRTKNSDQSEMSPRPNNNQSENSPNSNNNQSEKSTRNFDLSENSRPRKITHEICIQTDEIAKSPPVKTDQFQVFTCQSFEPSPRNLPTPKPRKLQTIINKNAAEKDIQTGEKVEKIKNRQEDAKNDGENEILSSTLNSSSTHIGAIDASPIIKKKPAPPPPIFEPKNKILEDKIKEIVEERGAPRGSRKKIGTFRKFATAIRTGSRTLGKKITLKNSSKKIMKRNSGKRMSNYRFKTNSQSTPPQYHHQFKNFSKNNQAKNHPKSQPKQQPRLKTLFFRTFGRGKKSESELFSAHKSFENKRKTNPRKENEKTGLISAQKTKNRNQSEDEYDTSTDSEVIYLKKMEIRQKAEEEIQRTAHNTRSSVFYKNQQGQMNQQHKNPYSIKEHLNQRLVQKLQEQSQKNAESSELCVSMSEIMHTKSKSGDESSQLFTPRPCKKEVNQKNPQLFKKSTVEVHDDRIDEVNEFGLRIIKEPDSMTNQDSSSQSEIEDEDENDYDSSKNENLTKIESNKKKESSWADSTSDKSTIFKARGRDRLI